ncbi:MAG: right-handed parallel beta-helix repeat-containing protein [Aquihabitans sp.]
MAVVTVTGRSGTHIQAALDTSSPGDTVSLPTGRFTLERPLELDDGVTLEGTGPGATELVLAPGSNCHLIVNRRLAAGNRDLTVRSLTIDGTRSEQDLPPKGVYVFAFGIWFWNVEGVTLDNLSCRQVRQSALQLNGCRNVRITQVATADTGWSGIGTTNTCELVMDEISVCRAGIDTTHSGIHVDGGSHVRVDAIVRECSGNAVMVDSVAGPVSNVVVHAKASHSRNGVSVVAGADHLLRDVRLSGRFTDNARSGVLVSNAERIQVVDATITRNGEQAVLLQGGRGSRHCLVADCQIWDNPQAVVQTGASGENEVIRISGAPRDRRRFDSVRNLLMRRSVSAGPPAKQHSRRGKG